MAAGQDRRVYKPGEDGVRLPAVDRQVRACYTEAARAARIQGRVLMEAVVEADGSVGDVQVTESLDKEHGLDQQAVDALKQWTLRPAMRDGKPVAARIVVDTYFTLR